MNRTPIWQIFLLVLLLGALAATWVLKQKSPFSSEAAVSGKPATGEIQGTESSLKAASVSRSIPLEKTPVVTRDFFQPPALLKETIQRKESVRKEMRSTRPGRPSSMEGTQKNSAPSLPLLKLQGILWGEKPQAIINRKVLSVGDRIEEAEVTSVTPDGVTLSFNGQEINLTLKGG